VDLDEKPSTSLLIELQKTERTARNPKTIFLLQRKHKTKGISAQDDELDSLDDDSEIDEALLVQRPSSMTPLEHNAELFQLIMRMVEKRAGTARLDEALVRSLSLDVMLQLSDVLERSRRAQECLPDAGNGHFVLNIARIEISQDVVDKASVRYQSLMTLIRGTVK